LLDKIEVFHKISLSRLIDSCRLRPRFFFSLAGWFMTQGSDVARGRDVVTRWCALAEQRLEYLTDLFETGRWRRFHNERAFLENIREAKTAVETWRDLATREASRDNSAFDFSWLGSRGVSLPPGQMLRDQVRLATLQPAQVPAGPPQNISTAADTGYVSSEDAPSVPAPDPPAAQPSPDIAALPTLDIDVMQERYPLLRNAL
jgi:uncharacterized repeat protein (TIGR03809 family)